MDQAEKILDALVETFKDNKHGDSLEYLFTDKSYRGFAKMAIVRATMGNI